MHPRKKENTCMAMHQIFVCLWNLIVSYIKFFLIFVKLSIEGVPWGTTISNLDFSNVHYCKIDI